METKKIEEFLAKFDDQHLANLQCAAEDRTLIYSSSCKCLVGHFEGDYSATKWDQTGVGQLAREAEGQYFELGRIDDGSGAPAYEVGRSDELRREKMLPLIHAEWARRAQKTKLIEQATRGCIEDDARLSRSLR